LALKSFSQGQNDSEQTLFKSEFRSKRLCQQSIMAVGEVKTALKLALKSFSQGQNDSEQTLFKSEFRSKRLCQQSIMD
jgi:hypothetical protein